MRSLAEFSLAEIQNITGGLWLPGPPEALERHVVLQTDTRAIAEGDFFVPLTGEKFDANRFVTHALEQGALSAFVSKQFVGQYPELFETLQRPVLQVENPLKAYQQLATAHRNRMKALIISLTGSSGKTTTKEMLYTMLCSAWGCDVVQKTEKNYNNEIGAAYTLLNIQPETRFLVLELAMRGLGQIRELTMMAQPDVAMVINVGPAHIGLLGSLEAIAEAKCEIFEGLHPQKGLAIVNGDDSLLLRQALEVTSLPLIQYKLNHAQAVLITDQGTRFSWHGHPFYLGAIGSHFVQNMLACLTVCETLGMSLAPLETSLSQFQAGHGRGEVITLKDYDKVFIINDAYNANPDSMKAAITSFLAHPQKTTQTLLVLGAMNELGAMSQQYHRDLGLWLSAQTGYTGLILVGAEMRETEHAFSASKNPNLPEVLWVATTEEAGQAIQNKCLPKPLHDICLYLKGSRSVKLEEIITQLQQESAHAHLS
jgi:UDP-N-acetylmuramoyl-tripeptide--D-alanyl-D-alanine ligase